jgi:transforming growth factor-beta-induced protein
MRRLTLALLSGALAVGLVAGPVAAKQPDMSGMNIVDTAIALNTDPESPYFQKFDTLIGLIVDLELVDALSARGQLTVFAPTDMAFERLFAKLTPAQIEGLTPEVLTDIVLFHVAKGNRDAAEVLGSSQIRMLNGDFAMVNAGLTPPTIDGAAIEFVNVPASNGIIHVVSDVLLP